MLRFRSSNSIVLNCLHCFYSYQISLIGFNWFPFSIDFQMSPQEHFNRFQEFFLMSLILPWLCLGLASALPWPCLGLALALPRPCVSPVSALPRPWPSLGLALASPWPCVGLALPLPCPCLSIRPSLVLALALPSPHVLI